MKKRIITLLAILALLVTCSVFAVQADTENDGGTTTPTADVRTTFVCPCSTCVAERKTNEDYKCPAISKWQTLGTAKATLENGGHYYVNADTNPGLITGQQTVGGGSEVVILIDDTIITSKISSRLFVMNGPSSGTKNPIHLHLVGNNGGKIQHQQTGSSTQGPLVQVGAYSVGHLYLYGDLELSATCTNKPSSGGLIKLPSAGRLYIKDCDNMGLTNTKDPVLHGNEVSGDGGVVFLQSGSPQFHMECGTLIGGSAPSGNGNSIWAAGTSTIKITGGTIKSVGTTGSRIYLSGSTQMTLGGNATILSDNDEYTGNIAIVRSSGNYPKLKIVTNWTGKTSFKMVNADGSINPATPGSTNIGAYDADKTPAADDQYWVRVVNADGTFAADGQSRFNAADTSILFAESDATENPRVGGWTYTLMPYRSQLVYASGEKVWFVDNRPNLYTACANNPGSFIRPWTNRNMSSTDLQITETVYVDISKAKPASFALKNADDKLYVFDSTLTAGGDGDTVNTKLAEPVTKIGNQTYVVIPGASNSTIYAIELTSASITGVTLRPGASGLYFSAESAVNVHADVKAEICTGVAVSLHNEAMTDANSAWTATKGGEGNGILVQNIMKEGEGGNRGDSKIYAKACVSYGGEILFLADDVQVSLNELMDALKNQVTSGKIELTEAQKNPLVEFVSKWNQEFGVWADLLALLG